MPSITSPSLVAFWLACAAPIAALAQAPVPDARAAKSAPAKPIVVAAVASPAAAPPMQAQLEAIIAWIAKNFDLPANAAAPSVRFATPEAIAVFRYTGRLSRAPEDVARLPAGHREVVAAYDGARSTIYLPEGWSGRTPVEQSMLVHEMVHHLQKTAGLKFACPAASEKMAYAAQDAWLKRYGRDLARDFDIDAFTLLVTTSCGL